MVHRRRRASGQVIVHVAEVKPAGSDPAVFGWAAVVARRVWRATSPAPRPSKLTPPRRRTGAAPGVGGGRGGRGRDRGGVARLARLAGRARLDEARVRAVEVVPARVGGVE